VPTPETYDAFAIATPGLERVVRRELHALGVHGLRVSKEESSFQPLPKRCIA
jgi:hypothetical protein